MSRLGDRTADIFIPPDTFWSGSAPRREDRERAAEDQLPRPCRTHFAVAATVVASSAMITMMFVPVWFTNPRNNYLWPLFAPIPVFGSAFTWLQAYGVLRRSWLASLICALVQLPIGVFLTYVAAMHFSDMLDKVRPFTVLIAYVGITQLFGCALNFRWVYRLRITGTSPRWVSRYYMAELFAVVTGLASVAALAGLLFRR